MKFKITVNSQCQEKILYAEEGDNLLSALIDGGFYIPASCGGRGRCGKCKVKVSKGKVKGVKTDSQGYMLSCLAFICEDITVELSEVAGSGLTVSRAIIKDKDDVTGYGIALDIGTTTLAFYLVDLSSGKELDSYSSLNPQGVYGADVISRISACAEGNTRELHRLINEKINSVIDILKQKHGIDQIARLTVCGNTTMLHLFAGEDASPLGVYPFMPVFTETKNFKSNQININAENIVLLPSISAYVGSDITAGIVSTGMTELNKNSILIDIGTNGETALYTEGKLYCASTAAGPALEGANITCGMGGVEGAIDSVEYKDGNIKFTVIGDVKAKGICGSGLIDVIAVMLEMGIFDETGAFIENAVTANLKGDRFYITDDIFISQKDIREFQLAKSAICAGIKTITKLAGLSINELDNMYIAGGLGYYINHESAVKTGLLPKEAKDKITVVGNSAGAGAIMCLLSQKQIRLCEEIAESCINIELSGEQLFMEEYINNMSFDRV